MPLEAMAVTETSSSGLKLGLFSNILFTSCVKWLSDLVWSHVWLWDSMYFSPICPWDFQARILEWVVISFPRGWKAALYFSVSLKMGRLAQWTQCWIQSGSLSLRIWGTFSRNPWGICVDKQLKGRRNPGTIKVCLDKLPWSLRGARCPSLICTSGKETVQRNELLGRNVQIKRWPLCSFQDLVISLETCYTLTSVTRSCLTLCDPMGCSMPGFPVHHQLLELVQTHVHQVSEAIQPSHPLDRGCPFPPAFNVLQYQGLFQWVSSSHQVAKVLELQHQSFQWILRTDFL